MSTLMTTLARVHKAFPQLRLGQLIDNALVSYSPDAVLYYVTDEELELALNRYQSLMTKGESVL